MPYTAPSGYKALCTANLPDPTIADGSTAFDTVTYDGTQVTRSITGLDFGPDLVWTKSRSNTTGNELYDSVRGAQELLYSNLTDAETTVTNGISSFNSDGWTMGNRSALNYLGRTYVGWAWDAGSSNTTIAAGSLNSSVYDQSQDWSGNGTSSGTTYSTQGWDKAFNGQYGAYNYGAYTVSGATSTFTFDVNNKPTWSNKIEVYFIKYDGSANVNGGSDFTTVSTWTTPGTPVEGWYDISSIAGTSGTLSSITTSDVGSNYVSINAIRLDGKILVDSTVSVANVPTIATTVRANPSAGFSIVTLTGTGSSASVGHGLNAVPSMVIAKNRNASNDWPVWHSNTSGATYSLYLNGTAGEGAASAIWPSAPTSSVVNIGSGAVINASGQSTVLYCFAPVEGYSAMGSYDRQWICRWSVRVYWALDLHFC